MRRAGREPGDGAACTASITHALVGLPSRAPTIVEPSLMENPSGSPSIRTCCSNSEPSLSASATVVGSVSGWSSIPDTTLAPGS